MRNKMARDFCVECINQVLSDGTNSYIENPAIKFTEMAKNGDFDPLSEEEYTALLSEVKILAKLFNNRPRRAAGAGKESLKRGGRVGQRANEAL